MLNWIRRQAIFRRISRRGRTRYCPICKSSVDAFDPAGEARRPDAMCPICGSLERHRLAWAFVVERTQLLDGQPRELLHFAPEPCLERAFGGITNLSRVSTDRFDERADVMADIVALPFDAGRFHVVYCSHVLEHIDDDRAAMRELRRVVHPQGTVFVQVPITVATTYEDASLVTPEARIEAFGQVDHVRRYGPDVIDRLRECGFSVERHDATALSGDTAKLAVKDELLFECRPSAG
ncbi:MAG TPA: SAM-dependent methyltransferase [Sorangium sp.]|nr:SAM-dependent methyltransferase [Sorangium sp.]